ncbi:DMT family transporter [Neotabrizicola sp. sgz301269]|uniref:DMT family transporter n=1 Tax=Neotabrizicola sp. sgz301269 TaxID=3276282 RepID=UPI0037705469
MDLRSALIGLIFVFFWSSAFATARIIVADMAPLAALALRFLVSGLLALGIARALGQSLRLTRAQVVPVVVFGLCQNALYLGLNFIALQRVEASVAVIIAATMPLLVAALAWAIRGERLPALGTAGLLAGFAGVALIMVHRLQGGADLPGLLLCALGALALAVATLTLRGAAAGGGNLLTVVGMQMLVGSAALALAALLFEPFRFTPTLPLALAFLWQVAGPGIAATLMWFWLVGRIGATRAATFHFLNPFFGVVAAALLLGEHISAWDLAGVAVTMAGILAVQLSRRTTA